MGGEAAGCICISQNPEHTPEGTWKETWRKTISTGFEKVNQPNQETKRRVWDFENGRFFSISAVLRHVGDSLLVTVGGEACFRATPAGSFPLR